MKLVSENESLELSWVTVAQTGVYALTVNTGNKSLCKEFVITVLTATTSQWTGEFLQKKFHYFFVFYFFFLSLFLSLCHTQFQHFLSAGLTI